MERDYGRDDVQDLQLRLEIPTARPIIILKGRLNFNE